MDLNFIIIIKNIFHFKMKYIIFYHSGYSENLISKSKLDTERVVQKVMLKFKFSL